MGELFYLVVALYIKPNIQPVIIRNPELVPITEKYELRIIEVERSNGKGYRSTRLIDKISGKAEPTGQFIISHQAKIMWLVKIRWKKFAIIDTFFTKWTIKLQK